LFYLLSIRYKMPNNNFAKRYEPFCHLVAICYPLGSAIAVIFLDVMRPRGLLCWVGKSHTGINWPLYFGTIVILMCFVFILCAMVMTYRAVSERESAMARYDYVSHRGRRNSQLKRGLVETRETLKQAFYYVSAFFVTFSPLVLTLITTELDQSYYALRLISAIFYPLQGFWNFLVYIRRGYSTLKKENPARSRFWVLLTLILVPSSVRRQKRRSMDRLDMDNLKPSAREMKCNKTVSVIYSENDEQGKNFSLDEDRTELATSTVHRPSFPLIPFLLQNADVASSCDDDSQMIQLEENKIEEYKAVRRMSFPSRPFEINDIDMCAFNDSQLIKFEESDTEEIEADSVI